MAKYKITGTITIKVIMDVDDESITTKPEALAEGQKTVLDFYNVDVVGGYHDREDCIIELDASRIKKSDEKKISGM